MKIEEVEPWGGPGFEPWSESEHAKQLEQHEFGGGLTQNRDLINFVRSQQRQEQVTRNSPPEPSVALPPNCHWQLDSDNRWALLIPCGRAGYTKYSGDQRELEEFARHLQVF